MTPRITTYTGRVVNPLDLRAEDITIDDIAHALACVNRFGGHLDRPLSVAQHSVHVSRMCNGAALRGLLHDASEAYLGDVTKWLKETPAFAVYREAEARAQAVIYAKFGVTRGDDSEVEAADRLIVRLEGTLGYHGKWQPGHSAYLSTTRDEQTAIETMIGGPWNPWSWIEAEYWFMRRFLELMA